MILLFFLPSGCLHSSYFDLFAQLFPSTKKRSPFQDFPICWTPDRRLPNSFSFFFPGFVKPAGQSSPFVLEKYILLGGAELSETKLGVRSTSDRREKKREWPREGLILQPGTMENKIEFAENGDQGGLPVPRCYSSAADTSQRRPGTPLFFSWIQFSSFNYSRIIIGFIFQNTNKMGLLTEGAPLQWSEIEKHKDYIKVRLLSCFGGFIK